MVKKKIIFETIGIDKKRAKKLKSLFYEKLEENEKKASSTK